MSELEVIDTTTVNTEETQLEPVEETKAYVELSNMPQTRNLYVKNAFNQSRKYSGKRIRQDKGKRNQVMAREARLKEFGWSLLYFK